jgi:hypothetical protein
MRASYTIQYFVLLFLGTVQSSTIVSRSPGNAVVCLGLTDHPHISLRSYPVLHNETVLSIDRYVVAAETGTKVFVIQNPTRPARVSPGASLVFLMCVLAGGMLGSVFVLIRNAVRNRKQALAAS